MRSNLTIWIAGAVLIAFLGAGGSARAQVAGLTGPMSDWAYATSSPSTSTILDFSRVNAIDSTVDSSLDALSSISESNTFSSSVGIDLDPSRNRTETAFRSWPRYNTSFALLKDELSTQYGRRFSRPDFHGNRSEQVGGMDSPEATSVASLTTGFPTRASIEAIHGELFEVPVPGSLSPGGYYVALHRGSFAQSPLSAPEPGIAALFLAVLPVSVARLARRRRSLRQLE